MEVIDQVIDWIDIRFILWIKYLLDPLAEIENYSSNFGFLDELVTNI